MQSLLLEVFTELGGDCEAFIIADDALIHLLQANQAPALMVTDYTLPGQLDGRELALMVNQRWPTVPILLILGYGSEIAGGLPERIAFLQKPWSIEQLVNLVRQAA
jgi:DNA-binding NtrC family response regulator